ncbi:uncharacterized protein LOC123290771 isoform X9 [Chrysoperla carnea]|uniref:uncharacterized protein LOC123290771 isoform X9 n=1 Tax=Chrysoperla carnea TaxID=189513 RepID=UPI001D070D63|nr:uncharacterized protein LOC123290771 isoform X9 [Chrysoperla carnea]
MKFLICLTLVICGACGVLSAPDSIQDTLNELVAAVSSTAAPSTAASSTAASDPIQDALNGLNQYEDASKDLNDLIAAASSTAAPSTAASSTAAPDPIQDALNGLTQKQYFFPILDRCSIFYCSTFYRCLFYCSTRSDSRCFKWIDSAWKRFGKKHYGRNQRSMAVNGSQWLK